MIMPSGGSTRSSYSSDKISDSFKNNDGSGRESSGKPVSKQIPLDQFMEINVDVDVFNVIIKPGDKYEVDYECIDGFEPDVSLDGKVLNIKQPNRGINYFGGDYICELYIMVPQNSPLASVRINDNTGHIHIREATIYVDELTTDTGDIIVANVNSQTTKAVSNTGSVVMESVDMGQSVLSTDTGNVDVRASRFGACPTCKKPWESRDLREKSQPVASMGCSIWTAITAFKKNIVS